MSTLPILELRSRCDELAAANSQLFAVLGTWVTAMPGGSTQQLFVAAGRRHGWHAKLWRARRPSLPDDVETATGSVIDASAADRPAAYAAALAHLTGAVCDLGRVVDRTLDPGTARVIDLVERDLEELSSRLAAER